MHVDRFAEQMGGEANFEKNREELLSVVDELDATPDIPAEESLQRYSTKSEKQNSNFILTGGTSAAIGVFTECMAKLAQNAGTDPGTLITASSFAIILVGLGVFGVTRGLTEGRRATNAAQVATAQIPQRGAPLE